MHVPERHRRHLDNWIGDAVSCSQKCDTVKYVARPWHSSLRIEVADHGAGLASDALESIFVPFRRRDRRRQRADGLGLDLEIARRLVESIGGEVWADSGGPGRGTTFIVELPVAPLRSDASELATSTPRSRGSLDDGPGRDLDGLRVLVVEDEDDARWLLALLLERAGALVETAASAAEADTLVATNRPAILLSDIGMAGEDGLSFISRLRARERTEGIEPLPAVAVSAYSSTDDRVRALRAGFDAHLGKPVDAQELMAVVTRLAERAL